MAQLPETQRKANLRLALILASVAVLFGLSLVVRIVFLQ